MTTSPSSSIPAWLVVVDMQVAFADPASAWGVPGYADIEPLVGTLAGNFGERVVHTRFVPDPSEPGQWERYYDWWPTMRKDPSSAVWNLTLRVPDEARVLSLPTFSKWGPELEQLVGPDAPIVLCGVASDCCVLGTAFAAADAGRRVTVVEDACRGVSQQHHDNTMSLLNLLYPLVSVTTSDRLKESSPA